MLREAIITAKPFPEPVLQEAQKCHFPRELFARRKKFRGITIDPPGSPDLDQAFWFERRGKYFRLNVSLADISTVIPQCSAIETEAINRGHSRYFANFTDHMLPPTLFENFLSLKQDQKRPTLTMSLAIEPDLNPQFTPGFLVNEREMTYEQADVSLNDPEDKHNLMLTQTAILAHFLKDFRETGQFSFRQFQTEIGYFFLKGGLSDGEKLPNSEMLVIELMILTNRLIADFFNQEKIPAIFRNHGSISRESTIKRKGSKRAEYGPESSGHIGLGLENYMHATASIRRGPDLIDNRQLRRILNGQRPAYQFNELTDLSKHFNSISA